MLSRCIGGTRLAVTIALTFAAAPARADVDWARGLVTATAAGVADRQAPSPSVARGTSRRGAEDAAKKLLASEIAKLPVASSNTVAGVSSAKAAVAKAIDAAMTISAEPETDGSWKVTLGVPIEAIRQAILGPRALEAKGDAGPPVVVVDGVTAKPAIGWTINGIAVATVWPDKADKSGERPARSNAAGGAESIDKSGERPARSNAAGGAESIDKSGDRPARSNAAGGAEWIDKLAAGAPHIKAKTISSKGAITVDGMQGTAATLYVIAPSR